ncbi:MAG: T9SS type A sorting domain-containing protein [Flavobacteriales bacterium]
MKKVYLLTALAFASLGVSAQKQKLAAKEMNVEVIQKSSVKPAAHQKVTIWSNDFSVASQWAISNLTGDAQDWAISTSTSTSLGYSTGAWVDPNNTVTNENGYALFDSDAVGSNNGNQDALLTYTGTIDCSMYPNVVLEFNQRVRMWQTTETIFEVSNDNGTTWIQFPVNLDKATSTLYQENSQVNISSAAGGHANVKFRLRYIGSWDYAWLVDDVKIVEQPAYDLRSISPFVAGTNNLGIEYGKTPVAHLDASYDIGGSVFNFGSAANSNTVANVNFGAGLTYNYSIGAVLPNDTIAYGATETPALTVGVYNGTYTVSSTEEATGSALFANNIGKRNFEVTSNVYALDGIGINPTELQTTTALGSNSFNTPTGTIFANMYNLRGGNTNDVVVSLEIGIASTTTAGTSIQVSIIDTATFFADGYQSVTDLNGNVAESDYYIVTAADVAAGKITVFFPQPVALADGAYFAAVITEVDATNTNIIRILNDETVLQPYYASMIHLIGDATYSNGNAFAIRMNMGVLGLDNVTANTLEVYPNPASEVVTIESNMTEGSVQIIDLTGKVVANQTVNGVTTAINTTTLTNGMYTVILTNGSAVETRKFIVQH